MWRLHPELICGLHQGCRKDTFLRHSTLSPSERKSIYPAATSVEESSLEAVPNLCAPPAIALSVLLGTERPALKPTNQMTQMKEFVPSVLSFFKYEKKNLLASSVQVKITSADPFFLLMHIIF